MHTQGTFPRPRSQPVCGKAELKASSWLQGSTLVPSPQQPPGTPGEERARPWLYALLQEGLEGPCARAEPH